MWRTYGGRSGGWLIGAQRWRAGLTCDAPRALVRGSWQKHRMAEQGRKVFCRKA